MHKVLLERAEVHAASRARAGIEQPNLVLLSLKNMVKLCGSQTNAAKVISSFHGIKKTQGTISKALNGNGDVPLICNELRVAIGSLLLVDVHPRAMRDMANKFGVIPIYQDFLSHKGRVVLFSGCYIVQGETYLALTDETGNEYNVPLHEVEVY